MKTIQELLRTIPHDDVFDALVSLEIVDPDNLDTYDRVLQQLGKMEPKPGELTSIVITTIKDGDDVWWDISGLVPGSDQKFAIEFTPWEYWLPATVTPAENATNLSNAELLACILWEMTWAGNDPQEIAERHREIVASVDKLKEESES